MFIKIKKPLLSVSTLGLILAGLTLFCLGKAWAQAPCNCWCLVNFGYGSYKCFWGGSASVTDEQLCKKSCDNIAGFAGGTNWSSWCQSDAYTLCHNRQTNPKNKNIKTGEKPKKIK